MFILLVSSQFSLEYEAHINCSLLVWYFFSLSVFHANRSCPCKLFLSKNEVLEILWLKDRDAVQKLILIVHVQKEFLQQM